MSDDRVGQVGNVVGGSIAGRDSAGRDINNTYLPAPRSETTLARLFRKFASDVDANPTLSGYIDALEIYTRQVENELVIGLDQKLAAAKRSDQIPIAKRQKEAMFAELSRNRFSITFQKIYATLMAKVFEEFEMWVRPAIANGGSRQEIDRLVHTHVVKPIVQEMEECEYHDGVAIATVRGMIYFLTGNCHLYWHQDAYIPSDI